MNEVMNFAKRYSSMQRPRKHRDACARDRVATSGQTLASMLFYSKYAYMASTIY